MPIESQCPEQNVQSNFLTSLPKEVWIGWISSSVEAYNISIYSFAAPALASALFQKSTEAHALLFSYLLLFIGSCFLYPLGAFYYGFIGDKHGRQKTCIYSTLGLALATGLMAVVPIHLLADVAWIFFLILLCGQYFFSGGEYYGSIVFSLEHSEKSNLKQSQAGLMSAFSSLFAVFGLVAANGMAVFSMDNEIWIRVCFLVGGLGGLVSYALKNHCKETPAFSALSEAVIEKADWLSFVKSEWRKIICVTMVFAFFMVSYAFIFIFLPLVPFEGGSGQDFDTFKSLIIYGGCLIVAGYLADRLGVYKIMLVGMISFSIVIFPLCYLCNHLLVIQMLLTVCACLVIGPIHSWMLQQFDPAQRCRGIFLCAGLAISLFFGSTVPLCLMIFEASQSLVLTSIYPFSVSLASLYCFYRSC